MLRKWYPRAYAGDVFLIDYQKLYDKGYRGIVFDVDNTLVHHGDDSTPQIDALFRYIQHIGFKTVLLSNNDSARLERFLRNIDSPYVADANKPEPAGYEKALALLGISKEQSVCIGDQLFTDICGANRCGIDSILVHYITVHDKEKIGIRRHMEKCILFFFRFRRKYHKLEDVVIKE